MSTDMAAAGLQSQASEWNETLRAEYLAVFHYWADSIMAERAGSTRPLSSVFEARS